MSSTLNPSIGTQNEKEELFRSLFNTMAEGFALQEIITNELGEPVDYRFLEVNPSFERLIGKQQAEIIGKTLLEAFPNSEKVWIERYGRVALTGMPENFTEYSREAGCWLDVSAYCPGHGQFACIISDNTYFRNLEDQVRQSQKMESVGTLAGGVAHDFNNILSVIIGANALLEQTSVDNPEQMTLINLIGNSAQRAANLTKSLLAFSRRQSINKQSEDLNYIVKTMHDFFERIIGEDILLTTYSPDKALMVMIDRGQIEQVLMNLVANARDAMPHGGVVSITVSRVVRSGSLMELDGCLPGDYALIEISDTGEGIDKETQQRIFEPFFTTKIMGKGTGLGLSMAYGIIRNHDGMINVYSEPDEGTTFWIYLPLRDHQEKDVPVQ